MRKSVNPVVKILPVFATLFVVIGIGAIVLSRPTDEPVSMTNDVSQTITAATGTVTVLQTGGTNIQFLSDDGSVHECPSSWVGARIQRLSKDGLEIVVGEDQHHIAFDCTATTSTAPRGLLNHLGTRGVRVGEPKSDGAGTVIFNDGKNDAETVLRDTNSRPYREPGIVGWLDDGRVAVVVAKSGGRVALAVDAAGRATQLAEMPDAENDAGEYAAADGAFWYITVTPGPGIEFGPRGPSEAHRVADGKDLIVARNNEDAIEQFTAGPSKRFAYTAAGTLYVGAFDAKNIGTGKPLGWLPDGGLMVARAGHLTLINPIDLTSNAMAPAATDTKIIVSDGASAAWRVTLDEPNAAR